ncbi:UNVERIFIED_CONTAM: hypothetical protein GTU68_013227, partial [Idotea baltica]|nr:hypothetical protein [Idotea baltica]
MTDYVTVTADHPQLQSDLRALVRLSIAEDLRNQYDWTTVCLIGEERNGGCQVVPREAGICAGLVTVPWIVDEFDGDLQVELLCDDGDPLVPGQAIANLTGNVRDLLTAERTILNVLSRLCGVATQAFRYSEVIADFKTRLYDTRKTTPGWRMLEKYAVVCGGGHNHRLGLHDGFLIKDNHLALGGDTNGPMKTSDAAEKALPIVEIEVDSLEQLADVLPIGPNIILLDNFKLQDLSAAVKLRDETNPAVELEASGNVRIDTIAEIAATGVDRISSGALTHQATWLDLGLD